MRALDCSLRDGGFLNGWDFSPEMSDQIIGRVAEAGVDFIEVGYLDADVRTDSMGLPVAALMRMRVAAAGVPISAMMRATCAEPDRVLAERKGLIDLIRIPCAIQQPEPALQLAQRALASGFRVSLNLTNISASRPEDIRRMSARIPGVEVVYLADSRGAVLPEQVPELLAALRTHWSGPMGFHAHNNLGWARANTEAALKAGCTWIDGTLAGMGLGGRNLRIDEALELVGREPAPSLVEAVERDWVNAESALPRSLFVASAQANISQDWVAPLVQQFGEQPFARLLPRLPRLNWQTPEQVAFWFHESAHLQPCVRLRIYQAPGRDHESAEAVFFNQVKPVHERHGALFLGREVHADGQTIARWLYPNESSVARVQAAVAKDPETLKNRDVRMNSGLHGVAHQEWVHAWP